MRIKKHYLLFLVLLMCLSLTPLFSIKNVKAEEKTTVQTHLDWAYDFFDGMFLRLSNSDYTESVVSNFAIDVNNEELNKLNFFDYIYVEGKALREYKDELTLVMNKFARWGGLYIEIASIDDARNIKSVNILEGCQIPAYNGGTISSDKYYIVSSEYYYGPIVSKMNTEVTTYLDYANLDFASFYLKLTDSDYPTEETGKATLFVKNDSEALKDMNFWDYIVINGKPLKDYKSELSIYINLYQRWNVLGFKINSITDVREIDSFEIKEGCQIPAYNDGSDIPKCLTVTNSINYVKKVPKVIGSTEIVSMYDFGNYTYDGLFIRFKDDLTGYNDETRANLDVTNLKVFEELETLSHIYVNEKSLKEYKDEGKLESLQINYQTRWNTLYFKITGIDDVRDDVISFKVDENTIFPNLNEGIVGDDYFTISKEYKVYTYKDGSYPYDKETFYGISSTDDSFINAQPNDYTLDGNTYLPLSGRAKIYDEYGWKEFEEGVLYLLTNNASAVEKGTRILVEFKYPIDTKKFDILYLNCLTTDPVTFNMYKYSDLESPVMKINTSHAFENRIIYLPELADENGLVSKIVFETTAFSNPQMFIKGFSVINHEDIVATGANLLDNALDVIVNEDTVDFLIKFNKTGSYSSLSNEECLNLIKSHILFNDERLDDYKNDIEVSFVYNGFYNLNVSVKKDSTILRGKDYKYVSNSFKILNDFIFPNNEVIDREYVLSFYETYSITETASVNLENMNSITIAKIDISRLDRNNNSNISIYFSGSICGNNYYYAVSSEAFRSKDVKSLNNKAEEYYNELTSKNFCEAGFKRSILENVIINGRSIAEWYALQGFTGKDVGIIIHYYGREQGNAMMISIDHNAIFQNEYLEALDNGTATIEFKEGLIFPSGKRIASTTKYKLTATRATRISVNELSVYCNGVSVNDGDTFESFDKNPLDSVLITNTDLYECVSTYNENKNAYDVKVIDKETKDEMLGFTVKLNTFEREENKEAGNDKKKCGMSLASSIIPLSVLITVMGYAVKKRKENVNA